LTPANESDTYLAEGERQGWFALVCYVSDPLKSQIEALRRSIPGRELPPVHITVLPPRPLSSGVENACALVEKAARQFAPFEAQLSELRSFPETNFLYLEIDAGAAKLRELHSKLNTGDLHHVEIHEYRPHLTLGGPVPQDDLRQAERAAAEEWSKISVGRFVRVEELVCLWVVSSRDGEWTRVASYSLTGPAVRQTAAGYESNMLS
jgi:2'-5' RNA ligase